VPLALIASGCRSSSIATIRVARPPFKFCLARGLTAQPLTVAGHIGSELATQISRGLAELSARPILEFLSCRSSCRRNRASLGVGLYVLF
jgi:hypothetical protein